MIVLTNLIAILEIRQRCAEKLVVTRLRAAVGVRGLCNENCEGIVWKVVMSQEFVAAGVVLCGGQSKRMGRAKAWLPFAGEFMLPRVVRLLRQAVEPVVVVAAPDQEVPPLPAEVAVVRDEEKGRGPLQGLAAGLHALAGRVEAAYLSSCDVPLLRPAFVRRLVELLGEHAVCVPRAGGYHHPL